MNYWIDERAHLFGWDNERVELNIRFRYNRYIKL